MFWEELQEAATLFPRQNLHIMDMFNFPERLEDRADQDFRQEGSLSS